MRSLTTLSAALVLLACGAEVHAKPLSDGVSGTVGLVSQPGLTEAYGQQNFHPKFGMIASYQQNTFIDDTYNGWRLGANYLAARALGESWQLNAVTSGGVGGMKGPVHDHSLLWSRLDLDWETRQLLVAFLGELQRGNRMPGIDQVQVTTGYSPIVPELGVIQPWALLSWFSRSGTGSPRFLAMLRLTSGTWWIEVGSALTGADHFLSFAITL